MPVSFTLRVGGVLVGHDRYERGALEVRGGRIHALGRPEGEQTAFALPGLRNAHAHLDLSGIGEPPSGRQGFAGWVLELLRWRVRQTDEDLSRGAELGARLALAAGTTAVGDIFSTDATFGAVASSGLKGIGFREILGSGASAPPLEAAREFVARYGRSPDSEALRAGLSPHAPYSTSDRLYRGVRELARRERLPLSTHIAETEDEELFLREAGGELADLLAQLGAGWPFERPPGMTPIGYLADLDCLGPDLLLAHANYLGVGDLELLERSGATVVYCPRSHAHFSHAEHPVARMLELDISVALGTDSLASNRSLSIFDELACLRESRPDLSPAQLFQMATSAAAPLLDGGSGRLELDHAADLVVVRSPRGLPENLFEALEQVTAGELVVLATIVSGRVCHVSNDLERGLLCLT